MSFSFSRLLILSLFWFSLSSSSRQSFLVSSFMFVPLFCGLTIHIFPPSLTFILSFSRLCMSLEFLLLCYFSYISSPFVFPADASSALGLRRKMSHLPLLLLLDIVFLPSIRILIISLHTSCRPLSFVSFA